MNAFKKKKNSYHGPKLTGFMPKGQAQTFHSKSGSVCKINPKREANTIAQHSKKLLAEKNG